MESPIKMDDLGVPPFQETQKDFLHSTGVEGVTKGGLPHFLKKSAVNSSAPGAPAPRQTGPATGHDMGPMCVI